LAPDRKKEITVMEQREIAFIGENLYQSTLKGKAEGKWTQHDIDLEKQLYEELNALRLETPFNFYWHMQLSPLRFSAKDKAIVPIFTRYADKFDNDGLNDSCIYCLGVKGLYEATPYLLSEYKKHCGKSSEKLNSICNALLRIRDPKYISEYIDIISHLDKATSETSFFIDILGILKAKAAMPQLIKLLDYVIPMGKLGNHAMQVAAIIAIGQFKDPQYIKVIERFLNDPNPVAREYAAKAIKKMCGDVQKIKDEKGKPKWILV